MPERPTFWVTVGQGPTALAASAGGGCSDSFTLLYPFSDILSQRAVQPNTTNHLERKKDSTK